MAAAPSLLAGPLLRLTVAGAALAAAWTAWLHPTPLNGVLFVELGMGESLARWCDLFGAGALVLAAFAVFAGFRAAGGVGGLFVGLWFLTQALSAAALGGVAFAELAPLAHAARWGTPLALSLWCLGWWRPSEWLLRLAVAVTFAVHGWEALEHTPAFLDLVFLSELRLESWLGLQVGAGLDQETAEAMLTAIGMFDLVLAALVVLVRWPAVAWYMAFWGALTALSRPMAGGLDWLPEAGLRLAHLGGPLVLACLWQARRRGDDQASEAVPAASEAT